MKNTFRAALAALLALLLTIGSASAVMVDEDGYLLAGEDCKTSLPGVFAAGDCRSKGVRQLTTAVGDGAVAGLAACRWVDEHPN